MLEWLANTVLGKLLGKALDWLLPSRRRHNNGGSQPAISQPAVVVNPGVNLDANKLAEQSATAARELGRTEAENAWLRSENAKLRKALDAASTGLQQRSRTADDPSRFKRAVTEMEGGHPETAEALFRDIVMENRREAARAACNIGVLAFLHDTQKALYAFQESVELDPNTADGWIGLGQLQRRMGNLDGAEFAFGKVLDLGNSNDDDALRANALSNIGSVLGTRGDMDMAKDHHMDALKLNEKLGDRKGMARNYCDIGSVYLFHGELAGAEDMYRKALTLSENVGDKEVMVTIYCNIGVVLKDRGDLNGAEEMYRKSLVFSEELGHKEGIANAYGNLGSIFHSRNDLSMAAEMHRESLRINEDLSRKEGMAINYANLGFISEAEGDLPEACRLWKKARGLFSDLGVRNLIKLVDRAIQRAGCPS